MGRHFDYEDETQYTRTSKLVLFALFGAAFIVGATAFVLITPAILPNHADTAADSSVLVETVPASLINVTSVVTREATISQPPVTNVQAQHSGWLRKVEARQDQMIKAGQIIAVIEPLDDIAMQAVDKFRIALQTLALLQTQLTDTRYKLIKAETAAADAKIALAQAAVNLNDRQKDTKLANERLDQAQQSLQTEQDRLKQAQELYRQGAISLGQLEGVRDNELRIQQQVDQLREAAVKAKKQAEEAAQKLQSGQANLNRVNVLLVEARRQENAARKQVAKQQETVEQTRRDVQVARANRKPVIVKSPADGIVLSVISKPGTLVTPAMVMAKIRKLDAAIAVFRSTDDEAGIIKVGMPAALTVPQVKKPFGGKVVEIMPVADPKTMRKICLEVADAQKTLKPGQKATAQITVSKTKAVSIPLKSVVKTRKGPAVWVVTGGEAHIQPVRLMKNRGKDAIVTNGLRDGDSIIISTDKPLREGVPVVIRI